MGTWKIEITGTGCHHNNDPKIDANLAAADFVQKLKEQGHTVRSATFQLTSVEYPSGIDKPARRRDRVRSP